MSTNVVIKDEVLKCVRCGEKEHISELPDLQCNWCGGDVVAVVCACGSEITDKRSRYCDRCKIKAKRKRGETTVTIPITSLSVQHH